MSESDKRLLGHQTAPRGDQLDAASRLCLGLDDTGNGKRLAAILKGEAIHVVGRGWGVWDGQRYQFEGGGHYMLNLAARLQQLVEEEAAALDSHPVPEQAIKERAAESGITPAEAEKKIKAERSRRRRDFAKSCGNLNRIRGALEMAVSDFMVPGDRLDADRSVLNVANGTLDLLAIAETPDAEEPEERLARWRAALRPHDRDVLPTRLAGAEFDPEAEAPEWQRFVALAQPDETERRYLQRCCGMLLGGRFGEVALVFLGKGGNGKSTVVEALDQVLGDYTQPCRVEMFLEHRNAGGTGPTPEEAVLPGARALITHEPRPGSWLDAGKVKGLTGGDRRQANPKNKDVFNYTPVGVPVLQANKMPGVNDPSEGFWRRIYPVIFGVPMHELPEAERRDREQMSRIIERERPGILNWLLEGYAAFRAQGLAPPPRVLALKQSLRALADPVGQFLAEKTRQGTGLAVQSSDLHKAFCAWCAAQGDKPMNAKAFTAALLALDFERYKNDVWYWRGIELADASLLEDEGDFR